MTYSREEADNYKAVVARLNDDWRVILCRGGIQWIIQRRSGAKRHGADRWLSVAFHRLRDGLIYAVQERCGKVSLEAKNTLAQLPHHVIEPVATGGAGRRRIDQIASENPDLGSTSRVKAEHDIPSVEETGKIEGYVLEELPQLLIADPSE